MATGDLDGGQRRAEPPTGNGQWAAANGPGRRATGRGRCSGLLFRLVAGAFAGDKEMGGKAMWMEIAKRTGDEQKKRCRQMCVGASARTSGQAGGQAGFGASSGSLARALALLWPWPWLWQWLWRVPAVYKTMANRRFRNPWPGAAATS